MGFLFNSQILHPKDYIVANASIESEAKRDKITKIFTKMNPFLSINYYVDLHLYFQDPDLEKRSVNRISCQSL